MPSTYAHYRFGMQVRDQLSKEKRQIVDDNLHLYLIGLHGPDLLFYYKAISSHPIQKIGEEEHRRSGAEFFARAAQVIQKHEGDLAYLAYMYGLFNHFALDVRCHAYVEEKILESGISHIEIEGEFDRYLLEYDHKDPRKENLVKHIHVKKEYAHIISQFYQNLGEEEVYQALKDFVFYHGILHAPNMVKSSILLGLMRLAGKYDALQGFVMKKKPNLSCHDSNRILHKQYKIARETAVSYIQSFKYDNNDLWDPQGLLSYNFNSEFVK